MKLDPSYRASFQRVQAALDLDRHREILPEAKLLVAQNPEDEDAHGLLARVYLGLKFYSQSQQATEAGLRHAPASAWLHSLRALALVHQGKDFFQQALAAADQAVCLAPDVGQTHSVRGRVLTEMRYFRDARKAVQLALELDPDQARFHFQLGYICLNMGEAKWAEDSLRESLRLEPNNAAALNNLGVALRGQRRHQEALEVFRSAVHLDPTSNLAKENTHQSVQTLTRIPEDLHPSKRWWSRQWIAEDPMRAIVFTVFAPLVLPLRWWLTRRAQQRVDDLRHQDPEMHRLYVQIDQDRMTGRL